MKTVMVRYKTSSKKHAEENAELLRFCRQLIRFRRSHPILSRPFHPRSGPDVLDVSWHGTRAGQPDWSPGSRVLAFLRQGPTGDDRSDAVYVAMNMHSEALGFEVPASPPGQRWHVAVNTGMPSPEDAWEDGREPPLGDTGSILVGGHAVMILVARA